VIDSRIYYCPKGGDSFFTMKALSNTKVHEGLGREAHAQQGGR
jgi:hypothetical protein